MDPKIGDYIRVINYYQYDNSIGIIMGIGTYYDIKLIFSKNKANYSIVLLNHEFEIIDKDTANKLMVFA